MREFIKIILAFILIILTFVISDFLFGIFTNKIFKDDNSKLQYTLYNSNDSEIVFFGSSRANHHYDTKYITDSIGIKAFNAGQDGRGLTFQYPLIKSYLNKNRPELIILEINQVLTGEWNNRLAVLYPYTADNLEIIEVSQQIDPLNKYLLKSNLFRHNSNFISELKERQNKFNPNSSRGYEPIKKEKVPENTFKNLVTRSNLAYDSLEVRMLNNIIDLCKENNVPLIAVTSPSYAFPVEHELIDSIFKANDIIYLNNSDFRLPVSPENYFKDPFHLNEIGARAYTKYFMNQLIDSLGIKISVNGGL